MGNEGEEKFTSVVKCLTISHLPRSHVKCTLSNAKMFLLYIILGVVFVAVVLVLMMEAKNKGPPGIEPGTSRSAVECSTPEL